MNRRGFFGLVGATIAVSAASSTIVLPVPRAKDIPELLPFQTDPEFDAWLKAITAGTQRKIYGMSEMPCTALSGYDLMMPSKTLYPNLVPLRNMFLSTVPPVLSATPHWRSVLGLSCKAEESA